MIQLRDINKSFYIERNNKLILENINLDFNDKGLYLIKGESGSGKSTLLDIILGLTKPSFGKVYIDGKDLSKFNQDELNYYRSSYISLLNQNNTLLSDLNLLDNLLLVLKISNKKYDSEYINNLLYRFRLDEEILKQMPDEISGGELKRFQLVLALIKDTKVILLDEPDSSLDIENQKIIKELVTDISKDRLVIVVSHNIDLYKDIDNTLYEIKDRTIESNINELKDNTFTKGINKGIPFIYLLKLGLKYSKINLLKMIISFIVLSLTIIISFITFNLMMFNPVDYYNKNSNIDSFMVSGNAYSMNGLDTKLNEKGIKNTAIYDDIVKVVRSEEEADYYEYGKYFILSDDLDDFSFDIYGNELLNDNDIYVSKTILQELGIDEFEESFEVSISDDVYNVSGVIDYKYDEFKYLIVYKNKITNKQYRSIIIEDISYDDFSMLEGLSIENELYNEMASYETYKDSINQVLIVVFISFSIFNIFVITNYLVHTFIDKKDEIRKIRSLGSRLFDILIMFLSSLMIVVLSSIIVSIVFFIVLRPSLNKIINGGSSIIVNYLGFNGISLAILLLEIIVVVFLSIIFAYFKVERKK